MSEILDIFRALGERVDHPTETPPEIPLDEVRAFVRSHVARLLDHNPGLLMSIMYRVDVPEPKVQAVLQFAGPAEIPDRLTDLLIERQMEKVHTRRKYSSTSNP